MATPASHFNSSLEILRRLGTSDAANPADRDYLIRLAQVHATLSTHVVVNATNALVGTPGTLVPSNADSPYDLADLAVKIATPDPATAWGAGTYIPLQDGTRAYWNGSAWALR